MTNSEIVKWLTVASPGTQMEKRKEGKKHNGTILKWTKVYNFLDSCSYNDIISIRMSRMLNTLD